MATPSYKGQGQPAASGSGWLNGLFGTTTPAYKSALAAPQPAPASTKSAANTSSAPSTAADAATTNAMECDPNAPTSFAIVIPRQVIDLQQ